MYIFNMSELDELLSILADAPPGEHAQIDPCQTPKLRALIGMSPSEQATGLKQVLDECAFGGLASGFAMGAMNIAWDMAKKKAALQ